jgi:threonine aldolase
MADLESLAPPSHSFASDNSAGVHPKVMEALQTANHGHALAYGNDDHTAAVSARFKELFGPDCATFLVWGGTGANVLSLATMLGPARAVVCAETSHINVDETGAPERILGAKLIDLPTPDGKLRPQQVESLAHVLGVEHHAQPGVVSITQSTEMGTLYSPDEIAALAEVAHGFGMTVHMDGARIANAAAALRDHIRAFTTDAGVDVISFGGTKNGMMYGQVRSIPGVVLDVAPEVNSLFPHLPKEAIEPLRAWSPFYDWEPATQQVRWMTSFDTTEQDVDRFAAGVRAALDAQP